jgi:hypothetical protein
VQGLYYEWKILNFGFSEDGRCGLLVQLEFVADEGVGAGDENR